MTTASVCVVCLKEAEAQAILIEAPVIAVKLHRSPERILKGLLVGPVKELNALNI